MNLVNHTCREFNDTISITGKVLDATTLESLPYANIYLTDNHSIGTASDENGTFYLDAPKGSAITVSYVGYFTNEFQAANPSEKILLTPDDQLGTVVIEGENKKKKNKWFWWAAIALALGAVASSNESTPTQKKGKQPIKATI